MQCAIFTSDDSKILTSGVDKLIILWDLKQVSGSGDTFFNGEYRAEMLTKIETKCYLELAVSQTRLVAKG